MSARRPEQSAQALAGRAFGALTGMRDAFIFPLSPPPIPELGTASGFNFRLQDRGGNGHEALVAARNQLLGMAAQSKVLAGVRPDGLEDAPQLQLDIDRDKASALGVSFDDINAALDRAGLALRQRLPEPGRLQRVVVQADAPERMQPRGPAAAERIGTTAAGAAVGLRQHALDQRADADCCATTATRRCASPVTPRPAYSTGDAMAEMERLVAQLPPGFDYEWTGQSREEKLAGATALVLFGFRSWSCSCASRRCTKAGRSRSR